MTPSEWQQLKDKMDELNKRKKILEFSNATAAEWYALAHEYELIDSKANYHHCIQRAVHYAGFQSPAKEKIFKTGDGLCSECGEVSENGHCQNGHFVGDDSDFIPVEPESVYQWQTIENMGGG